MKSVTLASLALLAGCASTTEMAQQQPFRTYQSAKPRALVADCILNRVSSPEMKAERTIGANMTTVGFSGLGGLVRPRAGIYLFTIRDAGTGSAIEVRRLGKADLSNAETCF